MTKTEFAGIPADHPMLAGHFPGHPIVPGAWLLAWVVKHADQWLHAQQDTRHVTGVARVKFLRPMHPNQPYTCCWSPNQETLRFEIETQAGSAATGTLLLSDGASA